MSDIINGSIIAELVLSGSLSQGPITYGDYTISVSEIENGHRLYLTKGSKTKTVDILDGENGYSPTVKLTREVGRVKMEVTDKSGTKVAYVFDGEKGDAFKYEDFTPEQLADLKGPKGDSFKYEDFTPEQLAALKGDPFRYSDFTPEQLANLKGPKGDDFKYSDFTPEQLASLKGTPFKYEDFTPEQLAALKGEKGDAFKYKDFTPQQLAELKGPKGDSFKYSDFTPEQLESLKGEPGDPGRTPVKGTDYWTSADKSSMVNDVLNEGATFIDNEDPTERVTFPTWDDHQSLKEDLSALDSRLSESIDEISEKRFSTNIFDKTTMTKAVGSWWNNVGGKATIVTNAYTGVYGALQIPVNGLSEITFSTNKLGGESQHIKKVYNVFYVDADSNVLSSQTISSDGFWKGHKYTLPIPADTVYACVNIYNYNTVETDNDPIMVAEGSEEKPYEDYYSYRYINDEYSFASDKNEEQDEEIDSLSERVQILENADTSVKIHLAESYEIVVGDTLELFYRGLFDIKSLDKVSIKVSCSVGNPYEKRFIFTPTQANVGNTYQLTIEAYNDAKVLVGSSSTNIVVVAKKSNTSLNVLCMGDSLTLNGEWVTEFKNRLTSDGLTNVNLIGTCGSGSVKYEGFGGWQMHTYNGKGQISQIMWIYANHDKTSADQHSVYLDSNGQQWSLETIESGRIKVIRKTGGSAIPSTGTLTNYSGGEHTSNIVYSRSEYANGNPFWDDAENRVSFSSYATRQGVSSIDYCFVLLGWNDRTVTHESWLADANIFLNNIRTAFPNVKVVFCGIEIPSLDGLGKNYGCTRYWKDEVDFVFEYQKWIDEFAESKQNVFSIQLSGQFDSENNMQTDTRPVNRRNTKTEVYGINGVHPALSGYLQIADAMYRKFMSI